MDEPGARTNHVLANSTRPELGADRLPYRAQAIFRGGTDKRYAMTAMLAIIRLALLTLMVLIFVTACGGGTRGDGGQGDASGGGGGGTMNDRDTDNEGGGSTPPMDPSPSPTEPSPPPANPSPPPANPSPPPADPSPPPTEPSPPPTEPSPPPTEPSPPPADPTPPQNCIETATDCLTPTAYQQERERIADEHSDERDFKNQWGLETIRADQAWAQLELALGAGTAPGTGQTIGLIDSGIDELHPAFASKTLTETPLLGATNEDGSRFSHGTAVASVIAAERDDTPGTSAARGVAWGADIAMFAIPLGSGGGGYNPISLDGLSRTSDTWAVLANHVTTWSSGDQSLDFVNLSIGVSGMVEQYSTQELRDNFSSAIAAFAQSGAADQTLFIWSAGNGHGAACNASDFTDNPELCVNVDMSTGTGQVNARSPDILAGLAARISELRDNTVAVVAINEDGTIADFSNRCGIAAQWCLAAPGDDIRAAYFGPHPDTGSPSRGAANFRGTSFSAPMVTGSLAVMKHYFRGELSNTALLARLLATADRQGRYADSAIYGQGLLDLAAATEPVGATAITLGSRVDGPGINAAGTGLTLGHALGDSLTRSLAGQEIAVFDELGAPFWYSLGGFTRSADGPSVAERLHRFMAHRRNTAIGHANPVAGYAASPLGLLDTSAFGTGSGHLSLADRGLSLNLSGQGRGLRVMAFSTAGLPGPAPVSGGIFSWRPGGASFGLKGGWAGERETALGSRTVGAFGAVESDLTFIGIEGSTRIGSWHLTGNAEIGTVSPVVRGGLIADLSRLTTSAFSLQAERPLDTGTLQLVLSQPLRVETGRARLSVPAGRTRDGDVLHRSVAADLAPTGRQVEIAAQWHQPLGANGEMRLGTIWVRHPGHDRAAAANLVFLAGLRYAF